MIHKAKKSLGQNFLKSKSVIEKIIKEGEISPNDFILEIGPGKGVLTEKILEKIQNGKLIAVEKDEELFEFLKEKFKEEIKKGKFVLINEDILKFKMSKNVLERTLGRSGDDGQRKFSVENFRGESENVLRNSYKIIANIPYNITGAILKKFLTEEIRPKKMVLMVQKEVAERIIAKDKKESLLSISVKIYGEPKIITKVPARYFSPKPKVDSAVISINNISKDIFIKNNVNESKFWQIIHAGFAHKRKKLASNLKNLASKDADLALGNKRAEELTLFDWIQVIKMI